MRQGAALKAMDQFERNQLTDIHKHTHTQGQRREGVSYLEILEAFNVLSDHNLLGHTQHSHGSRC